MPVIKTRFYKPVLKKEYLYREAILDYLNRHNENPVILVVAAAGYGKSVTISQWLDQYPSKNGWISLDEDCNDVRVFLAYLIYCVREVFPGSLNELVDIIDAVEMPPAYEIANIFINEIVRLDEDFALVLDDYHKINNSQVHELINGVIKFPPEKFKIILLSRHDLPLKLNSVRTYGLVSELRMSDLQFSPAEIVSLSDKLKMEIISPELAEEVYHDTEGWIIGIRLILKELSEGKGILESIKATHTKKESLSRYLMGEILRNQSETIQKFLLDASLFERFERGLLEFINQKDSESILTNNENYQEISQFIENSMFIIPLSNDDTWYRFHHLIQNFLKEQAQKRYTSIQIDSFYLLASRYFENNNLMEEAIACAVKGNDVSRAVKIIADHWDEPLLRDQYYVIERWIRIIPAGVLKSYPDLLVIGTMLYDTTANYAEMKLNLDKLEAMLEPLDMASNASRKLWGQYHALRAGLNYFTGNISSIIENADPAIELLSFTRSYLQDYAMLFKAFALHISGQNDKAIRLYREHQLKIPPDYRLGLMRSHSFVPLIHIYQADLDSLKSSAKLIYQISLEERAWVTYIMACKFLVSSYYIQNDLDKIEAYIQATADHRLAGRPLWVSHTQFFIILSYLNTGQYVKMKQAIIDLISYMKSFRIDNLDDLASSFQVELALRQDDLVLAEKYAGKTRYNSIPVIFSFYFTQLTEVKLLIKKGDTGSMERAYGLLEKYAELGNATHNRNFLLQVYTLLALWHKEVNNVEEAIQFLQEALEIGSPGRYLRMFADFGEKMRDLLMLLPEGDRSNRFVSNIIRVIDEDVHRINSNNTDSGHSKGVDLSQLLTPRETEILVLVEQGYQNKEIADQLYLSLETINKYLYYAYQKLGVKNRSSAIARARELNLII